MTPQRLAAFAVAVVAFVFYVLTLAPSVVFIDSGELATGAATLGIAHPTGYPLFSLVGYLFTHLPIGGSMVYKANLMAAFFCAAGAGAFTLLIQFILSSSFPVSTQLPAGASRRKRFYSPPGRQTKCRECAVELSLNRRHYRWADACVFDNLLGPSRCRRGLFLALLSRPAGAVFFSPLLP